MNDDERKKLPLWHPRRFHPDTLGAQLQAAFFAVLVVGSIAGLMGAFD